MASVADHVHIGAVSLFAQVLAIIAVFGTIHLLSLTSDSRWARAWIALGF
jgi:hypothetical protein